MNDPRYTNERYEVAHSLFDQTSILPSVSYFKKKTQLKMAVAYAKGGFIDKAIEIAKTFSADFYESALDQIIKVMDTRKKTG